MFAHPIDDDVVLRVLQPHHAEALFALTDANRAHLRQWLPWLDGNTEVEHTQEYIVMTLGSFMQVGEFVCGVWDRGVLCGVVGYNRIDWDAGEGYLGYWLAKGHEGRGIMTRATAAFVQHAFEEYRLERVVIKVAPENIKSQAIPQRLGFRREGLVEQAEWLYDHHVDHVVNVLERAQSS